MAPIDSIAEVEPPLSGGPARERPPSIDADPMKIAGRPGIADDWSILVMVVCLAIFAGAFVTYVLHPAMTTLSRSVAHVWSHQGP